MSDTALELRRFRVAWLPDKPEPGLATPYSKQRVLDFMVKVIPGLESFVAMPRVIGTGSEDSSIHVPRVPTFTHWADVREEDPSALLVAMDFWHSLEVGAIARVWQERRFATIFFRYFAPDPLTHRNKVGYEKFMGLSVADYTSVGALTVELRLPGWQQRYHGGLHFEGAGMRVIPGSVHPVALRVTKSP